MQSKGEAGMNDLKKMIRWEGGFFAGFYLFTVLITGIFFHSFKGLEEAENYAQAMAAYGFAWLHKMVFVLMVVMLFCRQLFAAGEENREFIRMLPVKTRNRRLFILIAGVVFLFFTYLAAILFFRLSLDVDAGLNDLMKYHFLKYYLPSAAEYMLCLLAGFIGERLFKAIRRSYCRFEEGGAKHENN